MSKPEFDDYAASYADLHAQSIRLSGEAPDYFAEYKIRELHRLTRLWGMTNPAILDFGSGIGNSVPHLRRYFPASHVATADVSEESLHQARQVHGAREDQLVIKAGRVPAPDEVFDVVFTACVFHHIDHADHHACLRELARLTRPGGRLVLFEHNPLNPLTRKAVRECPFDANAHLIAAGEMQRRIAQAGWAEARHDFHVFFPAALARLRPLETALRWLPLGAQYACHARRPAGPA
ncbi:class I SAM-dependent methyltransferase [Candidatus Falkowbacteria bacterium]|nr:class I SAM-dependent methyltransferase [Candidatus Falkowbacteria bacterium]